MIAFTFELSFSEKLARVSDLHQPFNPNSYSAICQIECLLIVCELIETGNTPEK